MSDHLLPIGELAARTGVAVTALRYYDELGLVRPKVRAWPSSNTASWSPAPHWSTRATVRRPTRLGARASGRSSTPA